MTMSKEEIVREYRLAKDKNKQVKILAQLNDCDTYTIIEILQSEGAISGIPRKAPSKKADGRIKYSEETLADVAKFYGEGLSNAQIAERCGVPMGSVSTIIKKLIANGVIAHKERTNKKSAAAKESTRVKASNAMTAAVEHPEHYNAGTIECINYIKDKLSSDELRGFIKGNVIKYLTREAKKNKDEDLKKAQWYLNWYLEGQR